MKRPQYVDSTWTSPQQIGLADMLPPEPHAHADMVPLPDDDWLADAVADVKARRDADYQDRPTRMVSFWIATALLITVAVLLVYALPMLATQ